MNPSSSPSPEEVVQLQVEAYNARDLERFLGCFADDVEMYEHPATLLARGHGEMRRRFDIRFQEANLHAEILNRIVMGPLVIDHERVTRTFAEGPGTLEAIMIYEVACGKIRRSWSRNGARTLPG